MSVRPYVRLSHVDILFKRLYISSKFFSPLGSPIILVFPPQMGWQYSVGDPLTGTSDARGYDKILVTHKIIIIIIISTTMFMVLSSWQSHCESSPGSFDECRMAPSGPKTKPDDLGCESACTGCQKLHPPSPFIITRPESWYSFYHPTEGRRLSRPSWLVTYRDGLPVHRWSPIRVLTGSDVAQLHWSKPTRYH